jgi:hypothetical protein
MRAFGIFATICLLLLSQAAEGRSSKDTASLVILDTPLPTDPNQMEEFLWKQVATRPEAGNFPSASTSKWKAKYKRCADTLVRKAADQKLDSVSLRKVLDRVFAHSKGELAYLPVAAYHATMGDTPVWIVTVRWEYPLINDRPTEFYHVRVFVFDESALTQVGFVTCG